jgi:peptidoglycan/LPS O-acetylase OafA/YrhL
MTITHLQPATLPAQHRFHFLDALRGIAALLVITLHAPAVFTRALYMHSAYLAVDFFFCLSGFVIAFSYERRLAGQLSFQDFFVARIIRLYPLAALGTLFGTLGAIATYVLHAGHDTLLALVPQVLFGFLLLPDVAVPTLHSNMFPLDFMMWTLFFELVANFGYAVLVGFRFATSRILLLLASVAFLLLSACRIKFGTLNIGVTLYTAPVALLRVAVSFSIGVLVFRAYHRYKRAALKGLTASIAALTISLFFVYVFSGANSYLRSAAWELTMVAIVFPALVFIGAHISLASHWTSLCAFLGNVSYPLYILHGPLLWPLLQPGPGAFALTHATAAMAIMVAYVALLVFIARFAATFYDEPLRKRLTFAYQRRRISTNA